MGETWLALQKGPQGFLRPVAVKQVRAPYRGLFVREAQIHGRLHHANLVHVLALEEVGSDLYLVMEWINGLDLRQVYRLWRTRNRGDLFTLGVIGLQILEAITYCHSQDPPIVHGDVTPQNILISRHGEVKLADFGIAKRGIDSPVTRCGNPDYLPPEVWQGKPSTCTSDLYQVGMVLKEGVSLCPSSTGVSLFLAMLARVLQPDPSERVAHAQLLRRDLEDFLGHRSASWREEGLAHLREMIGGSAHQTQELCMLESQSQTLANRAPERTGRGRAPVIRGMGLLVLVAGLLLKPGEIGQEGAISVPVPSKAPGIPVDTPAAASTERALPRKDSGSKSSGILRVQANPWAYVFLNTVQVGSTPQALTLKPGTYRVELVNPQYRTRFQEVVQIRTESRHVTIADMRRKTP